MITLRDTPVETYEVLIPGCGSSAIANVDVKREDLSCLSPGPPFAKVRGLLPNLQKLTNNYNYVGYVETSISMASWGISYFCQDMGLKPIIFMPHYKELRHNQKYQLERLKHFGATIIDLGRPNMMRINYNISRKILNERYEKSHMLPLGLSFIETVNEVSKQVKLLNRIYGSIVVSVGSGTMTAGIMRGLQNLKSRANVYGVFCDIKNIQKMTYKILGKAGIERFTCTLFEDIFPELILIDAGYQYTHREDMSCPFPCNPYYDRKAWAWMINNYSKLEKPVLFWNIGSDFEESLKEGGDKSS